MSQRYWGRNRHKIFICGTYAGFGADKCTDHRIFYDDLYNAVLNDIRNCAKMAFENREKAVDLVYKKKGKTNVKHKITVITSYSIHYTKLYDIYITNSSN